MNTKFIATTEPNMKFTPVNGKFKAFYADKFNQLDRCKLARSSPLQIIQINNKSSTHKIRNLPQKTTSICCSKIPSNGHHLDPLRKRYLWNQHPHVSIVDLV